MTPCPFGQILTTWYINLALIIYMIVFKPLKDTWTRRLTLIVEIFAFGCMNFGFVFAIIDHFVTIDATTLNEIGFAFIAFSLCSTFTGMILSLIQVISLAVVVYRYLKNKYRKRKEVRPLSLGEYPKSNDLTERDAGLKRG